MVLGGAYEIWISAKYGGRTDEDFGAWSRYLRQG